MSLLEHLFMMVNICVPAFAMPGLFLKKPRFRLFKAALCISAVAAWTTFVIILTVEGLPLSGSRYSSNDLERYITALYVPLAIILCFSGLARAWSQPTPVRDPVAKSEDPPLGTPQRQTPTPADTRKPRPSEPLSPLAQRIVGTALMQAGQAHNEPQMIVEGQRLLSRLTGKKEN